jgi:hypothetical protein
MSKRAQLALDTGDSPKGGVPREQSSFANARHLAMFKANPEKYAPQFGGLCANNMSNGAPRESDPTVWIIANDRLYVFAGTAGRDRFRLDPSILGARAASNWRELKNTTSQYFVLTETPSCPRHRPCQ